MTYNIDALTSNADWIKHHYWEFPTEVHEFLYLIGGEEALPHFMTLPVATAMPDALRQALTERSVFKSIRPRGARRVKYSEDEARDENGRWTSGGGGDAAAANSGDTVEQERLRQEIMTALGTKARHTGGRLVKYSPDQERDDHGRFGDGSTAAANAIDPTKGDPEGEITATTAGEAFDAMNADRFDADVQEAQHPENYEPNRGYSTHLKEGGTEWRRGVDANGVPTIYQVVGKPWDEMTHDERMAVPGTGNILPMTSPSGVALAVAIVPGSERDDPYVYRVVSEGEFQQAAQRGYFQSDHSMNLGPDEGTVASRGSTGSFYAPVDGENMRVIQFNMDRSDGWKVDSDGYVKTPEQIPLERVQSYSTTLHNPRADEAKVYTPVRPRAGRMVKVFDENEERDENGRWTSGGVGGSDPEDILPGGIASVPSDLGDLNGPSREAWAADIAKYGVKTEDLAAEIRTKIDQAAVDHAAAWYPAAHDTAQEIATKSGMELDRVAGAMSAMSGRCEWMNAETGEGEVKYLQSMAQFVADGKAEGKTTEEAVKDWKAEYKETNTILAFDENHERTGDPVGAKIMNSFAEKGMDLLTGARPIEDVLPENKQRSFFDNIMQPGATREVTCDTHMFKVFENAYGVSLFDATKMSGHDVVSVKNGISVNGTGYVALSEAVRDVADEFHTSPDVIQAAYWETVQASSHIEASAGVAWPSGLAATQPKGKV